MSTIKVDTIATRTGSGNITASNTIAGTSATLSGTLGVTGTTTTAAITSTGRHDVNFNGSSTQAFKYTDTGGGNLASFGQFYNPSNALIGNIQNANNTGIHLNVGTNGSIVFDQIGYTAANALDDYEEGTWTPDIRNADNANTFSTEIGRYVKIGSVVYIYFYSDSGNTGGGGGLQVRGLPFTYTSNDYIFGARGMAGVNNSSNSTRRNLIVNFNSAGTDTALLYYGGTFLSDTLTYVSGFAVYKTDS